MAPFSPKQACLSQQDRDQQPKNDESGPEVKGSSTADIVEIESSSGNDRDSHSPESHHNGGLNESSEAHPVRDVDYHFILAVNGIIISPKEDGYRCFMSKYSEIITKTIRPPTRYPGDDERTVMRLLFEFEQFAESKEKRLESLLRQKILPRENEGFYGTKGGIYSSSGIMKAHHLPSITGDNGTSYNMFVPEPSFLYGYFSDTVAHDWYRTDLMSSFTVHPEIENYEQATRNVSFPFFVIDCRKDTQNKGGSFAAINQCVGGMVACLNIIHQLNESLDASSKIANERLEPWRNGIHPLTIENIAYGLTVVSGIAQFFVAHIEKGEEGGGMQYHVHEVDAFYLRQDCGVRRLRECVREVLKWGKGERLEAIYKVLNAMKVKEEEQV